jgi:hypothetical protein
VVARWAKSKSGELSKAVLDQANRRAKPAELSQADVHWAE